MDGKESSSEFIRVVHIVPSPLGGGAERLVRDMVALGALFDVTASAVYFSQSVHGGVVVLDGEKEVCLGLSSPRDPRAIYKLRRYLKNFDSNRLIIHCHLTWPFYYTPLAISGMKAALVYTEHNTYNRRRSIPALRLLERQIYRKYEKVFCISEGVRNALEEWVGPNTVSTSVVLNGVKLLSYVRRRAPAQRGWKLVSVGSLTYRKGLDRAIDTIALLRNEVESYVIVGEGPERTRLERLIRSHGLERVVKLVGWQNNVESYLHDAHLQLITSRWEGFGLVAVEGMSTGLPVMASDLPGLREVVGDSLGYRALVRGDSEAWARAIREFFSGRARYSEFSEAVRRRAEGFSLEIMMGRYVKEYEEILSKRGRK